MLMTMDATIVFTAPSLRRPRRHSSWVGRVLCFLLAVGMYSTCALSTNAQRRFTVSDDIELSHFGDPYTAQAEPITFSPDRQYFIVDTERGRIDLNRPESTLRVYRTADVEKFLRSTESDEEPVPFWVVTKSSYKDGPIITTIRWLADSSGFAFLAKNSAGNDQLFLGELQEQKVLTLTEIDQQVNSFDIRDRAHYVYCVQSPALRETAVRERQETVIPAKGHSIYGLLFSGSDNVHFSAFAGSDLSELWAVVDGKRFEVRDGSGNPIPLHSDGGDALALAPDGRSVVTALAVRDIPVEWETLYPSAYASGAYRIRRGHQDPTALDQGISVSEYVRIELSDGEVTPLTNAPLGNAAGWWARLRAAWSSDGRFIVLPDTFIPPGEQNEKFQAGPPCTAVVEVGSRNMSCLEPLHGPVKDDEDEKSLRFVAGVEFLRGSTERVETRYRLADGSDQLEYHSLEPDGSWKREPATIADQDRDRREVDVAVKQDLNAPPVLVGTDIRSGVSKEIWNPNPQLRQIALGEESVFRWKDEAGRDWIGGLYKPPDYVSGRRYPLVIQTHGFRQRTFNPAGTYPTGFAAQELAAAEIVVLQVEDCPVRLSTEEASCQVAGYEAAVKQLAAQGLIDPDRVGISGFSRTCYYVMQTLTDAKLHLRAASITDGIILGYMEYIMHWNLGNNEEAHEADSMIGAAPFGKGLEEWLERSPEFNLDKVAAPLQVIVRGHPALLTMWEPYAGLSYLKKPVDLILLPDFGTHPLTNPAQRAASQTAIVDWFRFWLKEEIDPDPQKRREYDRWRALRDLEQGNLQGKSEPVRQVNE